MKIGTNLECLQPRFDAEELFGKIKEIGFDGIDYMMSPLSGGKPNPVFGQAREIWTAHFKSVKAALTANGLQAFQTHATLPTNHDGARFLSDRCLDQYRREIEAAAIIGSPYIVIHPINLAVSDKDREEDFKANVDMFCKLEPTLREFDVKLGVENMVGWNDDGNYPTGCSTASDMVRYIEAANSDRFVACLDTGHMHILGHSLSDAVKTLGNHLKLMHVHDNYGKNDNHNPPGFGTIDWKEFISALKSSGYDGVFSLEVMLFNPFYDTGNELIWDFMRYAYSAAKTLVG